MAARSRFPFPFSPFLLNLFSRSKNPISPLNFPLRNPNPNFSKINPAIPRLFSSASLSAIASPPVSKESKPSLGHITRTAFPFSNQVVHGSKVIYLDNATTSQLPYVVLNAMDLYYKSFNSNVHRGFNNLSAEAIDLYELARAKVAAFINARDSKEIVFTKNATDAINLVAYSWGLSNLKSGDEVLLTIAEHHSAIVPWQRIAKQTGATLKYVGLTEEEVPDIEQLKELLSTKTKLVVTHQVSNTLASVLPIEEIVSWSHDVGSKVLVDACQSVPHMVVDAQKLDVDFLVASSHKMCGPTAIGFLYAKSEILSAMPPFLSGGEMVADVFEDHSTFSEPPSRFEAGAPPLAQAVGLAAAIDYLSSIGMQRIHDYEKELANYLYHGLSSIPRVRIYGPSPSFAVHRAPLCSFRVKRIYPNGIATYLYEQHGVAICSGHHCAQLLHLSLGKKESARASLRFYNTKEEVDFFIEALEDTIHFSRSRIFLDKQRGWREDIFNKGTPVHHMSDCSESEDDYEVLSDCSEGKSCSSKDGSKDDSINSK